MSVIRRPDGLGRRTNRRVLGATAVITTATLELLAVGTWFALVGGNSRSAVAALVGLGVLVFGSLLRIGVFDAATTGSARMAHPRRLVPAIVHAGCWVVWLLAAERIGGLVGLAAGAAILAVAIGIGFELERRAVRLGDRRHFDVASTLGASALVAVGATALLVASEFVDWTLTTVPLTIRSATVTVELGAFTVGLLVFAAFVFAAQKRRYSAELGE